MEECMQKQASGQKADRRSRDGGVRRGLHLHFDPTTGIAGDMAVAALVDAGVPDVVVADAIAAMKVPGLVAGFRRGRDTRGLHFDVSWAVSHHGDGHDHRHEHPSSGSHGHHHLHRPYAAIQRMLRASSLSTGCRTLAEGMFARLATVEGRIHDQPVEKVTFHEVGAFDSIADLVGVAAAITWLAPSSISASPPLLGSGTVQCAHGTLSVPAPATAGLLAGFPVLAGGEGELTTPTGALILTCLVDAFGPPPPLRVLSRGFGIGTRTLNGKPNALTVALGEIMQRHP
jgi:pyridinium-3,5-bisthiocarboxylic acid mononucleotide nickel chelatase